jgi:hypothetical protein
LVGFAAIGLAACDSAPGNSTLGVREFRLSETQSEMHIVGVGEKGETIARVDLVASGVGRELTFQVGDTKIVHSEDVVVNVTLPAPFGGSLPQITALMRDPFVRAALAPKGIQIQDETPVENSAAQRSLAERAYNSGSSSPWGGCADSGGSVTGGCNYHWPTSIEAGIVGCTEVLYGSGVYREYGCSTYNNIFYDRACGGTGSNYCNTIGPNGCAPCYSWGWSGTCAVWADPNSPNYCDYYTN